MIMATLEVMQDLQEARRRDAKKHAGWPTKMLQTCTCWSEDSSQGDPGKMMKELHEEAEAHLVPFGRSYETCVTWAPTQTGSCSDRLTFACAYMPMGL